MDWTTASIISVAVIAGNFLISRGMDQRDKRYVDQELERLKKMIGGLFDFKDQHLRDSSDTRLQYEKQMSELRATLQVNQANYGEILRRLDSLDKKIDRIETRDEH